MSTDRWHYRVFQGVPDLIRALLPNRSESAIGLGLNPDEPGDRHYRFEAFELKELSHRLDGVLWPRESTGCAEIGSPDFPVVLLEVQMHPDPGFHHRLAAQTFRFLQKHPEVEPLEVVVITPHHRHKLGPAQLPRQLQIQMFLGDVHWISLEAMSRQQDLDPLLNLLTLPVRPENELPACSQQILASRPDLDAVVLPMLMQGFPELISREEIMVIAEIPHEELRHTRAAQEWLAEGRQEEAASVTLLQLTRRCSQLSEATTARIQFLPLEQLESLAVALLNFQGPNDLTAWLTSHS